MTSILNCNPLCTAELVVQDRIPQKYLNDNHFEIFKDYDDRGLIGSNFLYDRTGGIPHFLNIDSSASKIPTLTKERLSFYEITERRCKELLSYGKRINVSWSGGIDSTFVLFSLYSNAVDKDQIRVYGTYNSIIESGDLFDKYIKNNFDYNILATSKLVKNYDTDLDEIYVTGNMGNQLFTPGLKYNRFRDYFLKFKEDPSNKEEYFLKNSEQDIRKILTEDILEFLDPALKNSPKNINTLQELRWYIIFNFTWYSVLYTQHAQWKTKEQNAKIHAFFNTDDFQRWSMYNTDKVTKTGDYSDERWQMREYIGDSTPSISYHREKKKATSVLSTFDHNWVFLMNDYSNIYLDDLQH